MPRFSFRNVVQLTKKELDKKKVEANQQLQKNNSALKKGVKALEDEVNKAKEAVESVAKEVKRGAKEKKALNTSLKSLIAKHSQAESMLIGKKSKLNEISKKVTKLIKDVFDKEKHLETLNKAIKHANEIKPDILKYKKELKGVISDVKIKRAGLDDLMMQEGFIKDNIKGLAKKYEEKAKPYIEEFDKVKSNIEKETTKIKDGIEKYKEESTVIAGKVSKKRNELKNVEAQVAASKSLLTDEFDKIKRATDDLKQLERKKALTIREIDDKKKRYEGWTIKEAEKVAKKVLKGRMDNIDKAELKDIFSAL